MALALLIMAGIILLSIVTTITMVGKPRKPLTGGAVASMVVFNLGWGVLLVMAATQGVEPW